MNENRFNFILIEKATTKSHMYEAIAGCKDIAVAGGSPSCDPSWTQIRLEEKDSPNAAGEVLSKWPKATTPSLSLTQDSVNGSASVVGDGEGDDTPVMTFIGVEYALIARETTGGNNNFEPSRHRLRCSWGNEFASEKILRRGLRRVTIYSSAMQLLSALDIG